PPAGAAGGRIGGGGGPGGLGGLLDSTAPSAALTTTLQHAGTTWAAATIRSNQAAGYQLASGQPVMAIGGFNGTDPAPTLAQFKAFVAAGQIHYFIGSAGGGATGQGSSTSSAISAWVTSTFKATTVGGTTLYDLTTPA
ncbi:MAG: glycosyl transferase, partial [Acidimicrobiales bacterium]|nr:glycosyl transferase [Acidimicrobiales bacterium]